MSKGQDTRNAVIAKAATLFNKRGFAGVSMSELMAATGLKKGGLYNHFSSKEEIMAEAFVYAFGKVTDELTRVIKNELTAHDKLKAVIEFYRRYPLQPTIEGGCPIVNCAVESDDANPMLREKVTEAMQTVQSGLISVVRRGQKRGEFRPDVDPERVAVALIAQIDGGIIITRSFGEARYMDIVCDQLHRYLETEVLVSDDS
jgi:TetR/AcrR family transcriptional repressor of nem operon